MEYDDDEGERSSTPTSTSTSGGNSDPDYWLEAKPDEVYDLLSPARFSYYVEKPIIMQANHIGVFGKDDGRVALTYRSHKDNSNIQDDDDPRLFKLHYFDLKNH